MLTQERLKELLDYDPETGEFRWKVRRGGKAHAGAVAGNPDSHGYPQIKIYGRPYLAHRLAWLYMHGSWPAEDIDHINGNPSDNRIANLREATRSENSKNMRQRSSNTSGLKGACWHKGTKKWLAQINHQGKHIHLGLFNSPEEAHAAYCRAALRLAGEFANDGNRCIGVGDGLRAGQ